MAGYDRIAKVTADVKVVFNLAGNWDDEYKTALAGQPAKT